MGITFESENMTPAEWAQKQVNDYNAEAGTLNEKDGYNCPHCKNKGDIALVTEYPAGHFSTKYRECRCMNSRRSIERMKKSGLENIIKECTFDKYEAAEPWQQAIKDAAVDYAKDPKGWFFVGGQSGSGKTHICTAICREFLREGRSVVYMLWRDDIAKLKGFSMDGRADDRQRMIDRIKTAEVLYIDDLFKNGKGRDGEVSPPTETDINTAFEILNYRCINPQLITVISSERTIDDIMQIDEAISGRINERSVHFNIAPDQSRNYRLRKAGQHE